VVAMFSQAQRLLGLSGAWRVLSADVGGVVGAAGLKAGDHTGSRGEHLDPAVVTHQPVAADEDRSTGADLDTGLVPREGDDLIVVVVVEAVPRLAKCRVHREKRLVVGP
jgi:hypothetical protein